VTAKLAATTLIALGAALAVQSVPAAPPSAVLVSFQQTGGFAAIERGLTVRRSGDVVSDGLPVKVKQLSPTRLRTLRAALTASGFASLRDRYESDEPIADGFVYRLGYRGNMVEIEQGATLPLRLARVFRLLRSLTYA
jgi:hypothetical protein